MKPANPMKRWVSLAAIAAAMTLSASAVAVPVLVGSATLNSANDLTVIQDGTQISEFLDLAVTKGMTVANAVATYGVDGFHWATGAEVAKLYGAFGFEYKSTAFTYENLDAPIANAANFVDYLGVTSGDGAFGWIDDNTLGNYHTYACISVATCTPNAFVENTASFWANSPFAGVYLVRDQANSVPEPPTFSLFIFGVAAAIASRKRTLKGKRGGKLSDDTVLK